MTVSATNCNKPQPQHAQHSGSSALLPDRKGSVPHRGMSWCPHARIWLQIRDFQRFARLRQHLAVRSVTSRAIMLHLTGSCNATMLPQARDSSICSKAIRKQSDASPQLTDWPPVKSAMSACQVSRVASRVENEEHAEEVEPGTGQAQAQGRRRAGTGLDQGNWCSCNNKGSATPQIALRSHGKEKN